MRSAPLPVVISVPHGGTRVPPELRSLFLLNRLSVLKDGDTWARELYALSDHVLFFLDTEVPRVVIDMNRASGDRPPENPDGVVKTLSVDGEQVWKDPEGLPSPWVDRLIEHYHLPYHHALSVACGHRDARLGIDCHTMLAVGPEKGAGAKEPRPLVCVSNRGDTQGEPAGEPVTAPADLVRAFRDALAHELRHDDAEVRATGPKVALNSPFLGGYLTTCHGRSGPLPWIQLEISRALYLPQVSILPEIPDESTQRRLADIRDKLIRTLRRIF